MNKEIKFEPDLENQQLRITFYHKIPDTEQTLEVWRTLDEDGIRLLRRSINEILEN